MKPFKKRGRGKNIAASIMCVVLMAGAIGPYISYAAEPEEDFETVERTTEPEDESGDVSIAVDMENEIDTMEVPAEEAVGADGKLDAEAPRAEAAAASDGAGISEDVTEGADGAVVNEVELVGDGSYTISNPRTVDVYPYDYCGVEISKVSTWDCIWFGHYWQESDSNGDGKVTQEDEKDPIKWRVLNVDSKGNALLLSDRLVDLMKYNLEDSDVTWESCTLRSFLNGYDDLSNAYGIDYSVNGFCSNAFSADERNAIIISTVNNDNNPVYNTSGGNDTSDKLFCLSLSEAMDSAYGFMEVVFTDDTIYSCTNFDPTREAVITSYAHRRNAYESAPAGCSGWWWLRSPGYDENKAAHVDSHGRAYSNNSYGLVNNIMCVRPALRINLFTSESFWIYAGTVSSDGSMDEQNKPRSIAPGGNESLIPSDPAEEPDTNISIDADEKEIILISGELKRLTVGNNFIYGVKWAVESAEPAKCVTVKNGVVTAKKAGKAVVSASYGDEKLTFNITVDASTPEMKQIEGKKANISATKNLTINVGAQKKLSVSIPANLRNVESVVSWEIFDEEVCSLAEPVYNKTDRTKATKASIELTPLDVGATWIVWSMTDKDGNVSQAMTKVIVKKPVTELTVSEESLSLTPGSAHRLSVSLPEGYTDAKDVTFSVKGKGVAVSRSGIVSAVKPGSSAVITVKYGKLSKKLNVTVSAHEGDYLSLNKTAAYVNIPKAGKTASVQLKISTPSQKKAKTVPVWSVLNESASGITVSDAGKVSIDSTAKPGSYFIKAADSAGILNDAYCEIIVK